MCDIRARGSFNFGFHLGTISQEAAAVGGAAATHRLFVAQTVQVVVERQLGAYQPKWTAESDVSKDQSVPFFFFLMVCV